MKFRMPDAAIHLQDVRFTWPGRTGFTLNVPELTVARGERLLIVGTSGAGKSTLLNLVCGIAVPDSGLVEVDGISLSALKGSHRDRFRANQIGLIFQMFNLLPYASPLENILLPLAFAPDRRKRLKNPRREALRLTGALGLPENLVLKARAAELSIGQQQRVAVSRALIGTPALIVADEPTSALDEENQRTFLDLLMNQTDSAGTTLLVVSHDPRLAERFDRSLDLSSIAITRERQT